MFSNLFHLLFSTNQDREREQHEAWLAEAQDLFDLENRMRELDRRPAGNRIFH